EADVILTFVNQVVVRQFSERRMNICCCVVLIYLGPVDSIPIPEIGEGRRIGTRPSWCASGTNLKQGPDESSITVIKRKVGCMDQQHVGLALIERRRRRIFVLDPG